MKAVCGRFCILLHMSIFDPLTIYAVAVLSLSFTAKVFLLLGGFYILEVFSDLHLSLLNPNLEKGIHADRGYCWQKEELSMAMLLKD